MLPSVWLQRVWRWYDLLPTFNSFWRASVWRLRGAQIGCGTRLPRTAVTWPHQVKLGRNCILQPNIFFNYDHYWTPGPSIVLGDKVFVGRGVEFNIQGRIDIGDEALIAAGCIFVDHDHGIAAAESIGSQPVDIRPILVGRDCWIGAGTVVLKGVHIGRGAVVGAGSVVTTSIPPYEVWCGVPARKIKDRV